MSRKSSIESSGFDKLEFPMKIVKIWKKVEDLKKHRGRRSCSTSYLSGNQVHSSPLVAIVSNCDVLLPKIMKKLCNLRIFVDENGQ